jgi:hypothetical protein
MGNVMKAIKGTIEFESVDPKDLLDVARSIESKRGGGTGAIYAPPGQGVAALLEWSMTDIQRARGESDSNEVAHYSASAVLHARRALACLVDWYLLRDGFSLCKDARRREDERAQVLRNRGLLDELTSEVLRRAIERRNIVEHEYLPIPLEQAEDTVELLRRTIQCLRAESDPANGPCFFGNFQHSVSCGKDGVKAEFHGWSGPAFFMCTFAPKPWLGAIVPNSRDNAAATVRRSYFEDVQVELLLEVLGILEKSFGRIAGHRGIGLWEPLAVECGLL